MVGVDFAGCVGDLDAALFNVDGGDYVCGVVVSGGDPVTDFEIDYGGRHCQFPASLTCRGDHGLPRKANHIERLVAPRTAIE